MGNLLRHSQSRDPTLIPDDSIRQEHKTRRKEVKILEKQQSKKDAHDHKLMKQWFDNLCHSILYDTEKWDDVYNNMCSSLRSSKNPKFFYHRIYEDEYINLCDPIPIDHPERLAGRIIFLDKFLYGRRLYCKGNRFHKCYIELIPQQGQSKIIILIYPKKH